MNKDSIDLYVYAKEHKKRLPRPKGKTRQPAEG